MIKLLASMRKWWATFRKRPYVEVISEGNLTKDGYPLELDWNSYFIEELDRYGIEGNSDEEMVEVWLLQLARAAHQDNRHCSPREGTAGRPDPDPRRPDRPQPRDRARGGG